VALAAPMKVEVFGTEGIPATELAPLPAVFKAAGGRVSTQSKPLTAEIVVDRVAKEQ